MSTLTITRGLPASGKTSWAKAWVAEDPEQRVRVNRDDLRRMVFDGTFGSFAQESTITYLSRAAVLTALKAGKDVVADDTNLRPKYVREWRRFALAHGFGFEVVEFNVDLPTCIERDAARERPVGVEVLNKLATYLVNGLLAPVPDEEEPVSPLAYVPNLRKPPAVIVDIDGTIALREGPDCRGPHDLSRVYEDVVNEPVADIVEALDANGIAILYCSGREDSCREETEQWLKDTGLAFGPVFMRKAGDRRRDSIVKLELFDTHIRDHYNVRAVLDDRNQVVDMWRSIGLTCCQVGEGAF